MPPLPMLQTTLNKKPALGKGLGALISRPTSSTSPATQLADGERIVMIRLEQIVPSPLQPRKDFPAEHLAELVESIRERGIIQPLIVRKVNNHFELIAGERRWRAAQQVALTEAPTIIREASDRDVLELALIENLQREDLNPVEEAQAYIRLAKEFSMTQEQIATRVGKSRASVANAIRLLDLNEEVIGYLRTGRLSVGHAKALLSIKSQDEQRLLAQTVLRDGVSVRMTEKMAAAILNRNPSSPPSTPSGKNSSPSRLQSPHIQRIENLLQHHLSTRVAIQHGEKSGTITIEYYGNDDLGRILSSIGVNIDT